MKIKPNPLPGVLAGFDSMLAQCSVHKFTLRELRILLRIPGAKEVAEGHAGVPSVIDIASDMGVNKPSISRSIRWLATEELVYSNRDAADGRRLHLVRTTAGDALLAAIKAAGERAPAPRGPAGLDHGL